MNTSNTSNHTAKDVVPASLAFPDSLFRSTPRFLKSCILPWSNPREIFNKLSTQNPLIFLDSASELPHLNRSILAWNPWLWVRARRESLEFRLGTKGRWIKHRTKSPYQDFQSLFQKIQKKLPKAEGIGAYGAFSYESGEYFERLSQFSTNQNQTYFEFIFPRQYLLFSHKKKEILRHQLLTKKITAQNLEDWFQKTNGIVSREKISSLKAQFNQRQFESIVKRAKEYIKAGDIYQANLSQEFQFKYAGSPIKLYGRLRDLNPSPFCSFLRFGQTCLISSSPELLISKKENKCYTRPIAGTRPRSQNEKEDRKQSRALLLSPKERAEHLMLLDLERNDLGRVCQFGSVKVQEQMTLERYSHVTHIVSSVVGKLKPARDSFDVIRALFPGGTVTGCPKIRSMEIIHELEKKPRGFYTGSLGFLGADGEVVLNIIIRTIVLAKDQGTLRVGAGIVSDSRPAKEYQETLHKAGALFKVLGVTKRQIERLGRDVKRRP